MLRKGLVVLALLALVSATAGCGGDDESVAGSDETQAITVDTNGDEATTGGEDAEEGLAETVEFDLEEQNNSGVTDGQVVLTTIDGQTRVIVEAMPDAEAGDDESPPHPAHIHSGTCDQLGDVVYPLEDVTAGKSQTEVDVSLQELLDGDFAVNVHKSADEIDVYVACGEIPDETG